MPTAVLCALAALLSPQDTSPSREPGDLEELHRHEIPSGPPVELASWLSDELRSARERWAGDGFTLEAYLTADASALLSGGARPGSTALRGLLDALVSVDGERVLGIPGSRVVVGVQAFAGDDGSAEAGVVQSYSNIDAADDRLQVARAWYEQSWGAGAAQLRVGKMDANGWFAAPPSAASFLHSSLALSPTILGLPTYPDTAFGLAGGAEVSERLLLKAGVFDGAANAGVRTGSAGLGSVFGGPADAFLVAEASAFWSGGSLAVGAWHHTGSFARFDAGEEAGAEGTYLVLDQRWREDAQGGSLGTFLQLGQASERVSPIAQHVGLGAVAEGVLLPDRRDALGLGVSWARLSDEPGAGFTAEAETAVELFWGLDLAPGLRIKPDLQYVLDPGGDASRDDAWIVTLRLTASL